MRRLYSGWPSLSRIAQGRGEIRWCPDAPGPIRSGRGPGFQAGHSSSAQYVENFSRLKSAPAGLEPSPKANVLPLPNEKPISVTLDADALNAAR